MPSSSSGSKGRRRRGQVKIIEALLTCIIILSGLAAIVYFGGVQKTVGASELEEVGANILSILDDQAVITEIVFAEGDVDADIMSLIEALLPPDVFFTLSITSVEQGQTVAEISNIGDQIDTSSSDSVAVQGVKTISMPVARKEFLEIDAVPIIDRSGSMGWGDPPRLDCAKDAAKTFVDQLNQTRDQVGLASFAWDGRLDHQLSDDFNSVKSSIDGLNADGATNMGEGVEKATDELEAHHRNGTIMATILLSDGWVNVDRQGNYYEEGEDRTPALNYVREEANRAGNLSIIIYTIGLGNSTDQFDEDLLKEVVRNGGSYYYAPSGEELVSIYEMIALDLIYKVQYDIVSIELTLIKAG